ncbi:hypothetical protein [Acidianus bottle-shaped virus]|uniref:Uncharacterized protein ORF81 n=1 Tax=Acidianus bottle-shaped virus (isolate Italy/Pozzuoli) TaxID=654911 RepID=Y081_ABVP|nr:hypothetical protein ABV_gp01 [Acidianus bottle-shaped virus]YP_001210361.1 hypothetical protein ABV_gp57 [Acidianus bottle-shaped virus]A4ZU87.1 RecName: Full=Uncharacterized protein ORF81 [Acidianus bottle-shaped virus (isolate Pozzuoli)]ABP73391.1 hypothetical protein [Acidianus bottle-shaped virus]ABP73447.1 hypothetical protein [Acidianus bottle-shaped virus]
MTTTHDTNTKKLKYQFHTIHSQRIMTTVTQKPFTASPYIFSTTLRTTQTDGNNAINSHSHTQAGYNNSSERFLYLICTYIT